MISSALGILSRDYADNGQNLNVGEPVSSDEEDHKRELKMISEYPQVIFPSKDGTLFSLQSYLNPNDPKFDSCRKNFPIRNRNSLVD